MSNPFEWAKHVSIGHSVRRFWNPMRTTMLYQAEAIEVEAPRTRDVLRWNFAPWDMLLVAGIAIAGFTMGVLDFGVIALERWIDRTARRAKDS